MILGITATNLTLLALLISLFSYYFQIRSNRPGLLTIGRVSFLAASLFVFFQAAVLMWGIHTHRFEWQYVFSYSARDLSAFYLTATFWGGQEGTFLLWLVLGSVYGLILIKQRIASESHVMGFFILVQLFIVLILIRKSPFAYVWDTLPQHFQPGQIPPDGRGLNPLLQNPWMIIHPPILFVGYSSTSLLFAFAMAALVTGKIKSWVDDVFSYSLFVSLALGTGIILGGYWAYTTLGWGGYWGWDPVENSSLIPWLISLALIHTLLIQRKNGGLYKTNIFLALLTFLLVLWGSFLTRSGVLSDFSVHSFSESELNTYLIALVASFGTLSLLIFGLRARHIRADRVSAHFITRESFMLFGALAFLMSAVFTFIGTSAPLFTGLLAEKAASVSIDFYYLLNAPVALLIGVFVGISPLLRWKRQSADKITGMKWYLLAGCILTVVAYFLGLDDIFPLILFFVYTVVIIVNGHLVYQFLKKRNYGFGGYMAHLGIGCMMIGIITSSVYEKIEKTSLPLGIPKTILGYEMTYRGFILSDEGKDAAVIRVSKNGSELYEAYPKFYWSPFNQSYMRNPDVKNLWIKDLYIAPIQVIPAEQTESGERITLTENNPLVFESMTIEFTGYEMGDHQMDADHIFIKAIINISRDGRTITLKPAIEIYQNQQTVIPDTLPGSNRPVRIDGINVDEKALALFIGDENGAGPGDAAKATEMLAIEVTEKPLINFLWFGTVVMIMGFVLALGERFRKKTY